jgi:U3 small nucleolar RNA-associated protein 3
VEKFRAQERRKTLYATTQVTDNMGKKRKAGGRAYGEPKAPKEEDSKLAINTWEDVADSEDEFHINRDKILLDEGPAAKKLRKWQEEGRT